MRELIFRGSKNRKNYFEGWYFKFVDEVNDLIIILIPGISTFSDKMAFYSTSSIINPKFLMAF